MVWDVEAAAHFDHFSIGCAWAWPRSDMWVAGPPPARIKHGVPPVCDKVKRRESKGMARFHAWKPVFNIMFEDVEPGSGSVHAGRCAWGPQELGSRLQTAAAPLLQGIDAAVHQQGCGDVSDTGLIKSRQRSSASTAGATPPLPAQPRFGMHRPGSPPRRASPPGVEPWHRAALQAEAHSPAASHHHTPAPRAGLLQASAPAGTSKACTPKHATGPPGLSRQAYARSAATHKQKAVPWVQCAGLVRDTDRLRAWPSDGTHLWCSLEARVS